MIKAHSAGIEEILGACASVGLPSPRRCLARIFVLDIGRASVKIGIVGPDRSAPPRPIP